jgi:hypothetical protein
MGYMQNELITILIALYGARAVQTLTASAATHVARYCRPNPAQTVKTELSTSKARLDGCVGYNERTPIFCGLIMTITRKTKNYFSDYKEGKTERKIRNMHSLKAGFLPFIINTQLSSSVLLHHDSVSYRHANTTKTKTKTNKPCGP